MGAVVGNECVIERGEDVYVFDSDGNRLLDGTASLWYCNVGHGREEIAQAVLAQMGRIETYSAFGDLATPPALQLAERLAQLAPFEDARVFLGSGGGDAVDTAAKLARRYWHELGHPEREVLVSRTCAYHGTHGYGTSIGGIPVNSEAVGGLLPDTVRVAHDSVEALAAEIDRIGAGRVAAFFLEPVIGAGGVHPPPPGYVQAVAEICASAGVLLIVDAVICGFGRLGSWFGIERFSVQPDMIVFAKGVSSGYLPLGGVLISPQVAAPFYASGGPVFRHGATYAGHSSCCAAALANIDILEREGLIARGAELERELLDALSPLAEHPLVAEVRGGVGMLAAVELTPALMRSAPRAVAELTRATRRAGVLVRPLASAVAVSPPLTATPEHFATLAQAIAAGLGELAAAQPDAASAPPEAMWDAAPDRGAAPDPDEPPPDPDEPPPDPDEPCADRAAASAEAPRRDASSRA
ncbi:MAG: aminotransferase family protein [Solirubrobacteraceae bacterium]